MSTYSDISIYLATAALVVAVLAIMLPLSQLRRQAAEQQRLAEQLQAIQRDLRALAHSAVSVGERVGRLEQSGRGVEQRLDTLGLQQEKLVKGEEDERSVEQAIKMASKGASIEELMEITGLSRGEAELVAMMHRLES